MKEQDYNELMTEMATARGITTAELEKEMQSAIDEAWDEKTKTMQFPKGDAHIEMLIRLIAKEVSKEKCLI